VHLIVMANDEERWVAAARRGDRSAFRPLVEAHARALFALCMRITRDAMMAEDAVQEVFFNAYRHLADFDGRSGFKTWLHRIAREHCIGTVAPPRQACDRNCGAKRRQRRFPRHARLRSSGDANRASSISAMRATSMPSP
jgi:RNA polymerase sigma factor (sigma-70 family)